MSSAKPDADRWTLPDLVVLSLLAERPLHGYGAVAELERRDVRDWAGISRPQVYYSLRKLERAGLIRPVPDPGSPAGPRRRRYAPTRHARQSLAAALSRRSWATQRPPSPFHTWLVLSIHARPATVTRMLSRRLSFLQDQIWREEGTLQAIRADRGPTVGIAAEIVRHVLRQFRLEAAWLKRLLRMRSWSLEKR